MTVLSDADARAHYRAVVARVDAIWRQNNGSGLLAAAGERCHLTVPSLRALRRIRCGAVRALRALGERV
jgi:hypothetical protein